MISRLLTNKSGDMVTQLFRYTCVGGIAFLFDFGSLFFLTNNLHLHYLLSAGIAFVVGLSINYALSVKWVFAKRVVKTRWMEFLIFAVIGVVGLGLNELFMWLFTEMARFHYMLSKVGSTVFVYLWNFFGRKFTLFK